MVVPFLILAGAEGAALEQLRGHRVRLCNPATGLYAARWNEDSNSVTFGQAWGTGNGWVAAGLARALRLQRQKGSTPAGRRFAEAAAEPARAVIDACLRHRRNDGLFHDVVDDPSTFVEANLAQMLSYPVCLGVADGWLPAGYAATGRSLLASARRGIDADGFVTGVCGAPSFDRPGTSAEAQAFFLLAAAAARSLDSAEAVGQDDMRGAGRSEGAVMTGAAGLSLSGIVLDAPDPQQLARFYQRLLGWEVSKDEPGWVKLQAPEGGPGLSFQHEDNYVRPVWPAGPGDQQMSIHLDIRVEDLATAQEHAVQAGAVLADFQPQAGVRVLLDPDGHPFCLFEN